ncbi:MAG: hypothetical protein H6P99_598 [Holophagaceae bacterium]|nr:hypothetical protein [Holophagaceae bacterium]
MHRPSSRWLTRTGERLASMAVLCLAASGLLALSACGGGSGAAPAKTTSSAQTVTLAGPLSGTAGALQFNQQPLQTTGAAVTLNGRPATTAMLQPGVVMRAKGTRSGPGVSLQSVDMITELKGPITALDVAGATLRVLDTVVTVNALTRLEQDGVDHHFTTLSLADFAVGDLVSVFGSPQAGGGVLATRIEREAPEASGEVELRGPLSTLDPVGKTFLLGSYLVSYGSATVVGTLAEGAVVEVEGVLSGSTLAASRVRVEDALEHGDEGEVEASGALANLDATAKTFTLPAFKVDYSGAAVEGTLAEGATVEAEGKLSATDPTLLIATKVEVRFPHMGNGASDEEAEGSITALSGTDLTVTVGTAVFWTDAETLILSHDAPVPFADLKPGDRVEVRALSSRTNAAGQAYAARIEIGR